MLFGNKNLPKGNQKEIDPKKVKLPFTEKLAIVESLGVMLASGIPILESLESVEEDSTSRDTKLVASSIKDSLQRGKTLADSFSLFPNIFDEIFINTTRAGEESGNLDNVLKELTNSMRQEEELKNDVKSALLYPSIVFVVLFFVLAVLFGFVVPKFAQVFERLNIPKSIPAQVLISMSNFISSYYLIIISFLVLLVILAVYLISQRKFRHKILTLSFHLPIFGNILRYLDLTKFSSTLALLLSAGIPIIRAVETAASVVVNAKTRAELEEITHKLTQGESLSSSMRKYKTFPTFMTRIISTGEKSGKLDEVLAEISAHYQLKMKQSIKTLATSLEPVLIVIVGVIVGMVMLAIIFPIYQLIGQVSQLGAR